MPDDIFDFVNRVAISAGRRAELDGLESLSESERTVMLVWWATGIIGNGGFQYFYEGAMEAAAVADAFDRIGCPAAADACRRSLQFFPNGVPPADQQERCDFLDSVQNEDRTLFLDLDIVIWETSDNDFEGRILRYIEANRGAFDDLK